ncbi:protein of unknown function UPF0118 [Alkalilimnicola ehrlichii MLHE-1]|uniref:AI-2E family transporter n=2 Tax=Alkalilimnicola ehrlichii TaxID=351052 RepID=Q0A7Z7_ALKEH|nr:protein of unknown function UPF0118 [Alkalilimnicola ehrlichii MLHE-1]
MPPGMNTENEALPPLAAPDQTLSTWHWLLGGAALVVLLAGLKAAAGVVTPLLLAAFLAIICAPPLTWMRRRGVPGSVAVLALFVAVGLAFFLLFLALQGAVESMAHQAPHYQARLFGLFDETMAWLAGRGVPAELLPDRPPLPALADLTGLARAVAGGVGQFTATTFLVLLAFMFLLLEETHLPGKLRAAFPRSRRGGVRARRFLRSVYRYLFIKSATSLATGLLVGVGLALIGVDFPVLWGILAGLLNFIPTVGSILAAIPAVLIAFLGLGVMEGLLALALYVAVNVVIGSVLEPRFMGHTLGLSPLVVLVSLMAWGWVLGPVGMLLSIPLTMIAKLALEAQPGTRWLAIMMSDRARGH